MGCSTCDEKATGSVSDEKATAMSVIFPKRARPYQYELRGRVDVKSLLLTPRSGRIFCTLVASYALTSSSTSFWISFILAFCHSSIALSFLGALRDSRFASGELGSFMALRASGVMAEDSRRRRVEVFCIAS